MKSRFNETRARKWRSIVLKASLIVLIAQLCIILPISNVESTFSNWPSPTTKFLRSVFMVSASDGWAVGDGGAILHWDGTSWSNWESPTPESLKSVYMVDGSDGWIVGTGGTILHWDGTSWSNWQSPITDYTLLSVYMLSVNDGRAVDAGGTIIYWDGTSWNPVPSQITEQRLFSVFMEAADNIWAVGDGGTIIHGFGAGWETIPSPTTANLKSVCMVDESDGWAVGDGGAILHWDGTSWENVLGPTTSPLYSVFMVSASDGWAVGADGTILRWNGANWNGVTSPTTTILHSSFMVGANDGWAVGDGGTILRWDLEPPVSSFTFSPSVIGVGETVSFDASTSEDPNGNIVSYSWRFGDGNTGTGMITSNSYASGGTYTVTLTVTDNDGLTGIATRTVIVAGETAPFPLWVLGLIIGGVTGVTAALFYFKRGKPKEKVLKPAEPTIAVEPTEISPPASTRAEVEELPKLSAKCYDTIALLNSFIEDPCLGNDRKAWKGFREFIAIAEQIEDEYAELIEIRNKLAVLRRKRNEYRSAGLDDLADKTEGVIQRNYGKSIRIIKRIQEKLPQLGN